MSIPPEELDQLIYALHHHESDCAVHSVFGAMLERASMFHTKEKMPWDYNGPIPRESPPPSYQHPFDEHMLLSTAVAGRVEDILDDMCLRTESTRHTRIIRALYSPPHPNLPWITFGELAPIAALLGWDESKPTEGYLAAAKTLRIDAERSYAASARRIKQVRGWKAIVY